MFKLELNLQLFSDGGEGASAIGEGAEGVSDVSPTSVGEESPTPQDNETEDRQTAYNKFKADFKAEYDAEVQGFIKERVKNANKQIAESKAYARKIAPVMEHLASKYNCDVNDVDAIMKAFDNDDRLLQDEAYERGMDVETLKNIKAIERENASLKAERQAEEEEARLEDISRQIADLQAKYPNFDPNIELENPIFNELWSKGVPMQACYEVAHRDEIFAGAMQYTANKVAEKVANSVASNKARPSENGLSSVSSSVSKVDVNNLSRAQINEYKRRAMNGERIDFKS